MKRIDVLIATMLMLLVMAPSAIADFAVTPTLDLTTSSNLAGATDAVYTFHFESKDTSTSVISFSLAIPAGYSVNPAYVTQKSGITVMKGKAGQLVGFIRGDIAVTTTATPGHYKVGVSGYQTEAVLTEPTPTAEGKLEVPIPSIPGVSGAVFLDVSTVPGFFVNPSTPGTYAWGPSLAYPPSGRGVATVPRSDFSQTITIVGPSVTTEAATSVTTSAAASVTTTTSASPTTTAQTVVTESETTTTQPAPSGAPPTETLVIGAVVLIVIIAGAALYVLRRKKTAG
jgi:hypothetical protein